MTASGPPTIDESIRRRFESAWRAGRPLAIEGLLPAAERPAYLATLEELVHIEIEFRWKQHQQPAANNAQEAPALVEEYLARFPVLRETTVVRRLIEQEFRVRSRHGDRPDLGEYRNRFLEIDFSQLTLINEPRTLPDSEGSAAPRIPGCDILGVLGRGGMGVVYKAWQQRLRRVVALKVLAAGPMARSDELARFRTEAEAVARLQHPHIVQIYEIGEQDGRPYCLLEFVAGGSLAARLAGTPQAVRPAAELVEILARTLQVVHEAGIIHRDLKPGNILLTAAQGLGQPKLTDFGLAKFWRADDADPNRQATETGVVLGTPSYMAPEQARGQSVQVSPAADVYALGAILYELLTGRPPFKAASVAETVFQVLHEEPLSAARLVPGLPRDLDTVCLKCLNKEPRKRYTSALELADDLRRFLDGRPIQARSTPLWEKAAKWGRRRPAAVALIALALVVLIGGIAAGFWHTLQIEAALLVADQRRREAETEHRRAEAYLQKARQIINETLDWVGHEQLAHVPHMEKVRPEVLKKALAFSLELLHEASADPALRQQVGQDYGRLAEALEVIGRTPEASQAHQEALKIQRRLIEEFPGRRGFELNLATTHHNLARLFQKTSRIDEASQHLRAALVLYDGLAARFPKDAECATSRANAYNTLGTLLHGRDPGAADKAYRQSLALRRALLQESPSHPEHRHLLAGTLSNLGYLAQQTSPGSLQEAEAHYREAKEMLDRLVHEFPDNSTYRRDLAGLCENMSLLAATRREWPKAEEYVLLGLSALEKLTRDFPGRPDYWLHRIRLQHRLALMRWQDGRSPDALAAYRQMLASYRSLFEAQPDNADVHKDLAARHARSRETLLKFRPLDAAAIDGLTAELLEGLHQSDYQKLLKKTGK
jgi:tetratricopeptide (TPR) repeat protein